MNYKWWIIVKAIFYALLLFVPVYFLWQLPNTPPPNFHGPAGWLARSVASISDLAFTVIIVVFYLGMMFMEIKSLPQPMLISDIDEKNRAAIAESAA